MKQDLSKYKTIATQFRSAIEHTPSIKLPVSMGQFPAGACGDACLLLGHHFKKLGLGAFSYVLGMKGDGYDRYSHAWLKLEDIIVDITADQFSEINIPVIVSTRSDWHEGFDTEIPNEADFNIYDAYTQSLLGSAYSVICRSLPEK